MSIKSFLNYISAILCGSFICLFFNMVNYPAELNPDISNYYNNFISKNWSYDIGYEFYQSLLRDLLGLNFQQFWLVTLFLICFFFFLISYKIEKLPFLVVNFIFLSEVFGTQVRFFLGGVVFIFLLNTKKGKLQTILLFITSLLHYGLILLFVLHLFLTWLLKTFSIEHILKLRYKVVLGACASFFISKAVVIYLLPFTRFSYYLDSFYLESKSFISFLYAIAQFVIMFVFITSYAGRINQNYKDKYISLFNIILLLLIISTSSVAVLSGRYLLINIIMESITASVIARYNVSLFILYFFISLIKLFPYVYSLVLN